MTPGTGFTKPPLERISFRLVKEGHFYSFGKATLKFSFRKPPLTLLTSRLSKVKVGVLRPFQQPGSYWDRSSELPLVGLEPTEVTAYD